jgi:hypothetical protein
MLRRGANSHQGIGNSSLAEKANKNRDCVCICFVLKLKQFTQYLHQGNVNNLALRKVSSVWLIEKSSHDDGFQGWLRDFFLGTNITTTIIVSVGAITKN